VRVNVPSCPRRLLRSVAFFSCLLASLLVAGSARAGTAALRRPASSRPLWRKAAGENCCCRLLLNPLPPRLIAQIFEGSGVGGQKAGVFLHCFPLPLPPFGTSLRLTPSLRNEGIHKGGGVQKGQQARSFTQPSDLTANFAPARCTSHGAQHGRSNTTSSAFAFARPRSNRYAP